MDPRFFLAAVVVLASTQISYADMFGNSGTQFEIEFVTVGDPGNLPDFTGPGGAVDYVYRIGKHEVSRGMIEIYNDLSDGPVLTMRDMSDIGGNRPERPVTGVSWNEAARFVNWLNTSQGHPPAYKFSTDGANDNIQLWTPAELGYDPSNLFRNSEAIYFLPSLDEWYKAGYYDGTVGGFWDYPTGSNSIPTPVAGGTTPGTVVDNQPVVGGPADITNAGGLSPYGTMAQGGNVFELVESASDEPNDVPDEARHTKGGAWFSNHGIRRGGSGGAGPPTLEHENFGFRVGARLPPPRRVSRLIWQEDWKKNGPGSMTNTNFDGDASVFGTQDIFVGPSNLQVANHGGVGGLDIVPTHPLGSLRVQVEVTSAQYEPDTEYTLTYVIGTGEQNDRLGSWLVWMGIVTGTGEFVRLNQIPGSLDSGVSTQETGQIVLETDENFQDPTNSSELFGGRVGGRILSLKFDPSDVVEGSNIAFIFIAREMNRDAGFSDMRLDAAVEIPDPVGTPSALVDFDSPVEVFVPTDDSIGPDWTLPGFDDSAWIDGSGSPVGFRYLGPLAQVTNIESEMRTHSPSAYLRYEFNLGSQGSAQVESLGLQMFYDDGFVAYLNGTPVVNENVPDGALTWDSVANSNEEARPEDDHRFDLASSIDLLVPGKNVLAIHGLNVGAESSDFLIAPILTSSLLPEPILQIDLEMAGGAADGQLTQTGWTSLESPRSGASNLAASVGEIDIELVANGGVTLRARGGQGEQRSTSISGTSWDDMVEDLVAADGGDGTITVTFKGLDRSQTYTMTAWHNDSHTSDLGFAGGPDRYEITPSITAGNELGINEAGATSNFDQQNILDDGDFNTSTITFDPDANGNASVLLTGDNPENKIVLNGITLSAVPNPLAVTDEPSASRLVPVAVRGDVVPGESGATFTSFGPPVLNSPGDLAFTARIAGESLDPDRTRGAWKTGQGRVQSVVRSSDSIAPGIQISALDRLVLRQGGRLGIEGRTVQGDDPESAARMTEAASGGVSLLGLRGGVAAGTSATYNALHPSAFAGDADSFVPGILKIDGVFASAENDTGIWADTGNGLSLAVREGSSSGLPGIELGQISSRVVADGAGSFVFHSLLGGVSVDPASNSAVMHSDSAGDLTIVLRKGDDVPGETGVTFASFQGESIGRDNCLVVRATVAGAGIAPNNDTGIWLSGSDKPEEVVAREGAEAPGGPSGSVFDRFLEVLPMAEGDVVFTARMRGDNVPPTNDTGVWASRSGVLEPLLVAGTPAPGIPGARIASILGLATNGQTGVAVVATLIIGEGGVDASNSNVLWLSRNGAEPGPVLRSGDVIDVRGDARILSRISIAKTSNPEGGTGGHGEALDESGRLAVHLNYVGGEGVFVIEPGNGSEQLPFDEWIAEFVAFSPQQMSPLADPDDDKIPNVVERALALDPLTPSNSSDDRPHALIDADRLAIRFPTASPAPPDLTYRVWAGNDLLPNSATIIATKSGSGPWVGAGHIDLGDPTEDGQVWATVRDTDVFDVNSETRRFMWITVTTNSLP